MTPPQLVGSTPEDASAGFRIRAITLRFDEPLDTTRLSLEAVRLLNLGDDFEIGGNDDTTVPLRCLEFLSPRHLAVYPSAVLPEGRYQFEIGASILADIAGNVMENPVVLTFTSLDFDEQNGIAWISDDDGDWNDAANWNTGEVPGPNDIVILDRKTANVTVTLSSGDVQVRSLRRGRISSSAVVP